MKVINHCFEAFIPDGEKILENVEFAARTCYRSRKKFQEENTHNFVRSLIFNGHESVLEHEKISVDIVCDRAVSHELVRHRLASYSQESQRYVKYDDIEFIDQGFKDDALDLWELAMELAENSYKDMLFIGMNPEEARSVLPNSVATRIFITANLREWRHIFKLRCSKKAHPMMRSLMCGILAEFKEKIPVIFDDIKE